MFFLVPKHVRRQLVCTCCLLLSTQRAYRVQLSVSIGSFTSPWFQPAHLKCKSRFPRQLGLEFFRMVLYSFPTVIRSMMLRHPSSRFLPPWSNVAERSKATERMKMWRVPALDLEWVQMLVLWKLRFDGTASTNPRRYCKSGVCQQRDHAVYIRPIQDLARRHFESQKQGPRKHWISLRTWTLMDCVKVLRRLMRMVCERLKREQQRAALVGWRGVPC